MKSEKAIMIERAIELADDFGSGKVLLFLDTAKDCRWFLKCNVQRKERVILVAPRAVSFSSAEMKGTGCMLLQSWSGNQTRFSRIKYAFLNGVLQGVLKPEDRVVCVLGPSGKGHLDTITVHDLSLSWSEEFPFEVKDIMRNESFPVVMAIVDIALDLGAVGREGRSIGTSFIVGDTENVMEISHQAVFNPFRGYPKKERYITLPEVVESVKELASLDGSIIISDAGVVEAAGRHLDAPTTTTKQLRGLGARHRAAAGMTRKTGSVAIVVSESTGKVTVFEKGKTVATLEPVISRRLE
ncbi:MAG: DNA integrity scanning protein DisA nucleotide-binding domain protein [Nitrospirota bacterium]|nr:MAG: DNA integrity scanning protein DisA nucleotide-binding domain protein [Nitrospirota bacterium]